jgi:hypothetical protein
MAPAVAEALKLRAEGWSRPRAVEEISSDLEAAFNWVDRNRDTIAQVLSLETPPTEATGSKSRRVKFVPPAQALKAVLAKRKTQAALEKAGPSIDAGAPKPPEEQPVVMTSAERLLIQRRRAWFREAQLSEFARWNTYGHFVHDAPWPT